MPAKKTTDETAETRPARPTHQAQLCEACGQNPISADQTHFACEHGSWDLTEFGDEPETPAE